MRSFRAGVLASLLSANLAWLAYATCLPPDQPAMDMSCCQAVMADCHGAQTSPAACCESPDAAQQALTAKRTVAPDPMLTADVVPVVAPLGERPLARLDGTPFSAAARGPGAHALVLASVLRL